MKAALMFIFLSFYSFAQAEKAQVSVANFSQFKLIYSYEYEQTGDKDFYKLIKFLSSQRKLSLKMSHYIYYYNGNYYIFHKHPVTDTKRAGRPIIIPESEAKAILAN